MCNEHGKTDTEITDEYIEHLEREDYYLEAELIESYILNIKLRAQVAELSRNNSIFN